MDDLDQTADVEQRVTSIVADIFDEDPAAIDRDTEFVGDLNAKSMDIIALLAALEGEFDIPISASEVRQNETVGAAVDWIEQELAERGD
ncbi:MAG: acyl carrier protein [Halolamina sp.]